MHKKNSVLTRRAFLRRAATAAAVPYIVPSTVFGRGGKVAPSDRIILGGMGVGNRGRHDLNWMLPEKDVQFVAICDAKQTSREKVKEIVDKRYGNNDCKMYSDMREFLAERTDIDVLLIATGDRWHSLAAIMAMRAGKDVYSEKPSSMTIAEGQAVVETARRYRRIYQTGTQRLSEGNFTFCNEMLRLGRLGEVHTVRAHIAPWDAAELRHDWLPAQPEPPKEEVDWDQWLGPCPWRPYNKAYIQGAWRGHYDFHTSCIGEWGAHTFAQCQVGMGAWETSGIEYKYVKNKTGDGMEVLFENGIKMVLQLQGWRGSCGVKYEGTEGWVAAADGYSKPDVSSPAMLDDFRKLVYDYQARTQRPMSHVRDLLDCVKSRRQTVANPVMMHRTMTTVHAANICMWLKRDLRFDSVKEEFVNDEEANRLRSRAMREPWMI
ncbi:MAG: Gfo/Idh/MocA family oxidoreductase [Planctomycetota bacterium]|nr:MAG: Gfo/Idh/MocA family oxidoreductase [Planctomycetota bacterium]